MAALNTPADLKYAKTDEWLRIEGSTATVGLSDYAQDQLNDVVFVELPEVGTALKKGERFASVESVKAASDLYAPVAGTITEVNSALTDEPELLNADPYARGWIVKLALDGAADTGNLLDSDAYIAYNETR